jgi:hypothetical protein
MASSPVLKTTKGGRCIPIRSKHNLRFVAISRPGKWRCGRPVNTRKDEIRDSMQRRNLKDEECFDRELWRKKIVFGLRKAVFTEKIPIYIISNVFVAILHTSLA